MPSDSQFKPRKQPSQARSSATVEVIIEAAAQVLAAQGYEQTTTNKIAEKAGVSIGSLYEYFPSKEAIFTALIHKLDDQMAQSVFDDLAKMNTLAPEALLETLLRTRIDQAKAYPQLDKLLRAQIPAHLFTQQMEQTFERFSQAMKLFASLYPERIRVSDLDTAIELGSIVVESTIRSIASNHPERLEDEVLVKEFVEMMLRYILKD